MKGLYDLEVHIGSQYDLMFTDKGGNDERAAFFYDSSKIDRLQLTGELAIPPADYRHIKLPTVKTKFTGFDRNPFIGTFQFRNTNNKPMILNPTADITFLITDQCGFKSILNKFSFLFWGFHGRWNGRSF